MFFTRRRREAALRGIKPGLRGVGHALRLIAIRLPCRGVADGQNIELAKLFLAGPHIQRGARSDIDARRRLPRHLRTDHRVRLHPRLLGLRVARRRRGERVLVGDRRVVGRDLRLVVRRRLRRLAGTDRAIGGRARAEDTGREGAYRDGSWIEACRTAAEPASDGIKLAQRVTRRTRVPSTSSSPPTSNPSHASQRSDFG